MTSTAPGRSIRVVVAGPPVVAGRVLAALQAPGARQELEGVRLELDRTLEHLWDAGALVFVAEATRGARAQNALAFTRLTERLAAAERPLGALPHLVVALRSPGVQRLAAPSLARTLEPLGLAPAPSLAVDLHEPGAADQVLDALAAVLREALAAEPRERHAATRRVGARRVLGAHYARLFGSAAGEHTPEDARLTFVVLEHPPAPARDWWTYATCGLSLHARDSGTDRRLELLAYSGAASRAAADALLAASATLLGPWAREPIAPFDTVDLSALERLDVSRFILSPAREPAALLDFPSTEGAGHRDFLAAVAEPSRVRFLELFPVTAVELELALHDGARTVLGLSASHRPGPRERWTAPVPLSDLHAG